MIWNRDYLGEPHVKVWAIICNNKKATRTNSDANSIRKMFTCKGSNGDRKLDSISEFFKTVFKQLTNSKQNSNFKFGHFSNSDKTVFEQYSNSFQTIFSIQTVFKQF